MLQEVEEVMVVEVVVMEEVTAITMDLVEMVCFLLVV